MPGQPSEAAARSNAPIADRRLAPRLKTLLTGILVFDENGTTMDCVVRNISAYGAKVVIADAFRLPDEFNLRVPHHDQTHRAKVIWRRGDDAGLALADAEDAAHREHHRMTPRAMKRAHQREMDAAQF
jgi:hypothetical protein